MQICEPPQGEFGRQLSLPALACREQATAIRSTFVTKLEDWSECSLWLNRCFLPSGGRSMIWSNSRFKSSHNRCSCVVTNFTTVMHDLNGLWTFRERWLASERRASWEAPRGI